MTSQLNFNESQCMSRINTAISKKCFIHKDKKIKFISTDPTSQNSIFKCTKCLEGQKINIRDFLDPEEIIDGEGTTIFSNWPLCSEKDNVLLSNINSTSREPHIKKQLIDNQIQFLVNMREEIQSKTKEITRQYQIKVDSYLQGNESYLDQYIFFSKQEDIKDLLLNQSLSNEQLETQMRDIIANIRNNENHIRETLTQSFTKYKQLKSLLNTQLIEDQKNTIIELVEGLDFFHAAAPKTENNVDNILNLLNNKLNFINPQYLQRLTQVLRKYSYLINKVELGPIHQMGVFSPEINLLNDEEFQQVNNFISRIIEGKQLNILDPLKENLNTEKIMKLISNKSNLISNSGLQAIQQMLENVSKYIETYSMQQQNSVVPEIDYLQRFSSDQLINGFQALNKMQEILHSDQQSKEYLQEVVGIAQQIINNNMEIEQQDIHLQFESEDIIKLIFNQSNVSNPDFYQMKQLLTNALMGVRRYIHSFNFPSLSSQPFSWLELNPNQIEHLTSLGNKIKSLSLQLGQNCIELQQPYQSNSFKVYQTIKDNRFLSEQALKQLLIDFPIFELSQNYVIPSEFLCLKFIKTNFVSSSSLNIKEDNFGVRIFQQGQITGTAVTENVLDNQLTYVISCDFNKPLQQCKAITIGLIEDDCINQQGVGKNKSYFFSHINNNPVIAIKGCALNSEAELKTIEFRFCIEQQLFLFSDSLYTTINQADPKNINKQGKYRFGITFFAGGDHQNKPKDYNVYFSNFRVYKDPNAIDMF